MHAFPARYAQCRLFQLLRFCLLPFQLSCICSFYAQAFNEFAYSYYCYYSLTHTYGGRNRERYTHINNKHWAVFQSGNLFKYFGQNTSERRKRTRKPKPTWNAVHSIEFHAQHERYKHNIFTRTRTHISYTSSSSSSSSSLTHTHSLIAYLVYSFALHVSNVLWLLAPSLP